MKQSIRDKLESLVGRLDELDRILASGEATRDMDQYRRLAADPAGVPHAQPAAFKRRRQAHIRHPVDLVSFAVGPSQGPRH